MRPCAAYGPPCGLLFACAVLRAVLGGLAITAGELLAGLVLNVWLGLGIWDYAGQWGSLWGQVCPLYTLLWCLLAGPVIVGFDWLDYWLCGGERPGTG